MEQEEVVFYITLSNHEDRGTIRIHKYLGRGWETVCTWNPRNFNSEFIVFDPITVLSVRESDGSLHVSWIDRLEYHEGLASIFLDYDYQLEEWEEFWVD